MTAGSPGGGAPIDETPRGFPDFVGVGALKAGTSYLDSMLRSHPGLSLPLHLKEVDYFNTHLDRGPDWYESQFAPADGRPRGEVSPQYFFDADCPARIAKANHGARLLVNVRQPVQRVFSQYRHWVQETGYRGDFDRYLAEHPGAVERSRYWELLERFRAEFPDDQIHVVVFEEMIADPAAALRDVYAFLGVDPEHVPATIERAVNVSGTPRFPRLYTRSKAVTRWLYAHGAGRTVDRVKATGVGAVLRGRAGKPARPPAGPSPAVVDELAASLRADARSLAQYLDRDLLTFWEL